MIRSKTIAGLIQKPKAVAAAIPPTFVPKEDSSVAVLHALAAQQQQNERLMKELIGAAKQPTQTAPQVVIQRNAKRQVFTVERDTEGRLVSVDTADRQFKVERDADGLMTQIVSTPKT